MKFGKIEYIGNIEDFCVQYYINVSKFVKLSKFSLLEYFSCAI